MIEFVRQLLRKISPRHITWILAFVVLVISLVALFGDFGWKEVTRGGPTRMWKRGSVYQIDSNRDGIVDEEINYHGKDGKVEVRKDMNFDGYFDLRYNLGTNGIAYNVKQIHERAPHRK